MKHGTKLTTALILAALTTNACATLLNPPGAFVAVPDSATATINGVPTPTEWTPRGQVLPLRNHEHQVVVLAIEGQPERTCTFFAKVGTLWVVLDVLLGVIPLLVDGITGAWRSIDPHACSAAFETRR